MDKFKTGKLYVFCCPIYDYFVIFSIIKKMRGEPRFLAKPLYTKIPNVVFFGDNSFTDDSRVGMESIEFTSAKTVHKWRKVRGVEFE